MRDGKFEAFEKVLYRLKKHRLTWQCGYVTEESNETIHINGAILFKDNHEIIPYEGNEHLWNTNDDYKPKRWRAEYSKIYWFLSDRLKPLPEIEAGSFNDIGRYDIGNYFETQEEAEKYAEKFREHLMNR